jgi:Ubiquitin elongating factor core
MFQNPTQLHVHVVKERYGTLRTQMMTLQGTATDFVKKLLTSSPDARERVFAWLSVVLQANVGCVVEFDL